VALTFWSIEVAAMTRWYQADVLFVFYILEEDPDRELTAVQTPVMAVHRHDTLPAMHLARAKQTVDLAFLALTVDGARAIAQFWFAVRELHYYRQQAWMRRKALQI
jgi:hypothetical protein